MPRHVHRRGLWGIGLSFLAACLLAALVLLARPAPAPAAGHGGHGHSHGNRGRLISGDFRQLVIDLAIFFEAKFHNFQHAPHAKERDKKLAQMFEEIAFSVAVGEDNNAFEMFLNLLTFITNGS